MILGTTQIFKYEAAGQALYPPVEEYFTSSVFASKTVFVYVHIMDSGEETVRILSSNNPQENIFVRGLDAKELTFSTKVEDFDGNITELEEKQKLLLVPATHLCIFLHKVYITCMLSGL